jgi:protein SCO1/2
MKKVLLLCIVSICFSLSVVSQLPVRQANPASGDPEIGIVEKLEDTIPADIVLINHRGEKVLLGDLIDKTTVISLVYYRCPSICTPLMNGIAEVINKTDMRIGRDYQVLTISFDPREGTELALNKHRNYMQLVQVPEADSGWTFFTTDSATIKRITHAVGFKYKPAGNDFTHAAVLIVISPDRKITRYLNGVYYQPFEFKMALIEASKGQAGPTINRVLQFCYSYDPQGKQYVLSITRVTGILISLIAVVIFLWLAIKPVFRRKQRIKA